MNNQETKDIVFACLQLPDSHKRGLLRMLQTSTKSQILTGSNLTLYMRIIGLPKPQQMEIVRTIEEDLKASDRLLAKNIRLGKKRNSGKVGSPEVEAS